MSYSAKDYRQMGMDALKTSWSTGILCFLLAYAASAVLTATGYGGIVSILITGPLTVGTAIVFLQMSRYHNAQIERVLDAFRTNLANNIVAGLLRTLFIVLWSLLFVIPGIIKAYAYAMMPYILADNPNMSSMDALRHSERLMHGHKGDLFRLHLSFIGWLILVALTGGLMIFYVGPYMQASTTAFYRILAGEGDTDGVGDDFMATHDFTTGNNYEK